MKLWKKIYLLTLVLFLVLINSGIFLVFHMTYQKDISVEQNRAQSVFDMMNSSLIRNMEVLDEQQRLGKYPLQALLETYEQYYKNQGVILKFWSSEECIYPEGGEEVQEWMFGEEERITIFTQNGITTVSITEKIQGFSQSYFLYYEQPLIQLTTTWKELQRLYLYISGTFSVLLAVVLLFLLRRLMKPVDELSRAVEEMKRGGYYSPNHVAVRGRDDIAKLGDNFNQMADIISENILKMKAEANQKQEFIDNFAHELKSPLTSIYGFAEYVGKARISDDEKEECMSFIMEESKRLLHLSYTLLDMAKLRGTQLPMCEFDAREFCKNVLYRLQDKMKEKKIEVSYAVGTETMYGNSLLLDSLIGNLLGNAINACEQGGIIKLVVDKNERGLCILVRDNGCGMNKEQVSHIMEPFYRVDKARSRDNGGTGLGLSLCRQIVMSHGGQITFDSSPGKGTIALVVLPLGTKE